MPSREIRTFSKHTMATLGIIEAWGMSKHNLVILKAGRNRHLNKRPHVRGVAMNPIDHPHGGGEGKSSAGRPSCSPWGLLTKGFKTRNPRKQIIHILKKHN
jgi:large subunit ribosomal protein L2